MYIYITTNNHSGNQEVCPPPAAAGVAPGNAASFPKARGMARQGHC